eukprot:Em0012g260a
MYACVFVLAPAGLYFDLVLLSRYTWRSRQDGRTRRRSGNSEPEGSGSDQTNRPLVSPDTYSGDRNWTYWVEHFEAAALVNGWDEPTKLLWLPVRLTGKAQPLGGGWRQSGIYLGLDFLEKHDGIIDSSKMVLQFEGVSIQLQHHADSSNSSDMLANEVSVSLIETVKIPAYSEVQTMAYTSSTCKGVWLVEGSRPDIPIIVAGAVVTPSIGEPLGSIPVLMCNSLPTETVVHKGTRIARATRLQDESLLAPVTDAMSQEKKIPKVSDNVFAESNNELRHTNMVEQSVDTGKNPPIGQQFRRMPPFRREQASKLIEYMLKRKIVQPSSSPWASPVVIAMKKDNSLRFGMDYLKLNSITRKCFQQHLSNLELVLDRLRQAGHRISRQGISTDPKRFLRFRTGRPQIQCKMSDSSLVLWDTTGNTFPILLPLPDRYTNLPNFEKPFILDTDACQYGIGAVLSQDHDGEEKVVAYGSHTYSKAERKYCVTRKELLAVVTFTKHFRPYLLERHFTLRTDHSSLQWLYNMKEPEGHLARWLEQLQEYDFAVMHCRGCNHGNADALSCIGPDENEANISGGSSSKGVGVSAVQPQQLSDKNWGCAGELGMRCSWRMKMWGLCSGHHMSMQDNWRKSYKVLPSCSGKHGDGNGEDEGGLQSRVHGKQYEPGDLVWLHTPVVPKGKPRKLHCSWTGPFRVVKRLSAVTNIILDLRHIAVRRRKRMVVHFDHLKPCPSDIRLDFDDVDAKNPEAEGPTSTNQSRHRPEYPGTTLQFFDEGDDLEIAEQEIVQQPARGQQALEVHGHEDAQQKWPPPRMNHWP